MLIAYTEKNIVTSKKKLPWGILFVGWELSSTEPGTLLHREGKSKSQM